MLTPLLPLIRNAMLLTDLIPDISLLIPQSYEEIKTPETEKLLASFLTQAETSAAPKLIHMSGIPGAGKSTFYRRHRWNKHVFICFDTIMEQLPAYQQELQNAGSVAAFQKWEIPARIIGYELLRRAVSLRKDIFFDHGGVTPAHVNLMKNLKNYGYATEMYYISCTPEVAFNRALLREQTTLRHTPREIIEKRSQIIGELLVQYKNIVDRFYAYDNRNNKYRLVESIDNLNKKEAA